MAAAAKPKPTKRDDTVERSDEVVGGTLATYHQFAVDLGKSAVIPHVEGGWCQLADVVYVGGGNMDKRWIVKVVVFEPISETEVDRLGPSPEATGGEGG